jgi:hypothetical protein
MIIIIIIAMEKSHLTITDHLFYRPLWCSVIARNVINRDSFVIYQSVALRMISWICWFYRFTGDVGVILSFLKIIFKTPEIYNTVEIYCFCNLIDAYKTSILWTSCPFKRRIQEPGGSIIGQFRKALEIIKWWRERHLFWTVCIVGKWNHGHMVAWGVGRTVSISTSFRETGFEVRD